MPENQQPGDQDLFPVVGIGASAGGLEAFTQLLAHLPSDTGMAFVLVQHLDPNYQSMLTELLSRATQMPVVEVQDEMPLKPNRVHVIPPNTQMTLNGRVLQLAAREKTQGRYLPIDTFFCSLAREIGSRAIGVVLSGANRDGALGLEEIKALEGITFAQSEDSAQFGDMPHQAVATGRVDFILSPQAIAEELVKISRHPYPVSVKLETSEDRDALAAIFALLQSGTGTDFTHYKRTTLMRRLMRRMTLQRLDCLADYARHLQNQPGEVQALYDEILISVTSFFRDSDVFDALKEKVLPVIFQDKLPEVPIRIWVPGCATGEEVYSLAMCLIESGEQPVSKLLIQIFGTDMKDSAIRKARSGIYSESAVANVSPERLRRFFSQVDAGYQVSKSVRDLCIFAKQNLGSDPPFSNLDLISCRNVLIYMELALQKRVLQTFHYSLKPSGFLMLGLSESARESDFFSAVDKKHKLYTRAPAPGRLSFDFTYRAPAVRRTESAIETTPTVSSVQQQADRIVLSHYGPAGVVTNDQLDILQFRGETGAYLRPAPGAPDFNLLSMTRPGLLPGLRTAIYQARSQAKAVKKSLRIESDGEGGEVQVEVVPFKVPPGSEGYFLILFESTASAVLPTAAAWEQEDEDEPEHEIVRLKQELAAVRRELADTQGYLQSTISQQENTNQSLTTANEEILSSNEELQSTNEELQTAKEELQSANEELHTSNGELHSRNLESRQINNDLLNLLSNVNIPILMLTDNLHIRRFTPAAQKIFNVIATDVGRPLSDIRLNIQAPDLEATILSVIDTLTPAEREVQDDEGCWYLLRIRPYRTADNQIDGVVLAMVDISALKRSAQLLESARTYAESIVETVRGPLVVLDSNLRVRTANRSFYQTFQTLPTETEGQSLFALAGGQWNIPALRLMLEGLLTNKCAIENYEVRHNFENIGYRVILLNAREILEAEGEGLILLALEDITGDKQVEEAQRRALEKEQELNEMKSRLIAMASHEFRTPLSTIMLSTQLLSGNISQISAQKRLNHQQRIEKAIEQMTGLLDGILNIGQAESEQIQIQRLPLDLENFCRQLIDELQSGSGSRHRLVFEIGAPCPSANIDAALLKQILNNLLTNAFKYSAPESTVRLELACQNGEAVFKVADEGIGIASEDQERLFEPFYRGQNVGSIPGFGVGLAVVRRLVDLLGGQLTFESRPQHGTIFTVTLPFEEPTV